MPLPTWYNGVLDLGIWRWVDWLLHTRVRREMVEMERHRNSEMRKGSWEVIEMDMLWRD